jgi:hypothetical protein
VFGREGGKVSIYCSSGCFPFFGAIRHHGYNHQAKVSFINKLDMIRKQGIMPVFD